MPRSRTATSQGLPGDKPKGKMTAYAFFVQTCREEHRRKHPDENVHFAEFSKKCADRWKTMSDREKKRFYEMAELDKQRYAAEMKLYVPLEERKLAANGATDKRSGRREKKRIKDPNAPKRCISAFFWYSHDERPKVKAANPDFGVGDIAKELGRRWSEVSEAVKAKYEAKAEQDKVRYEKDKRAYQQRLFEERNGVAQQNANQIPHGDDGQRRRQEQQHRPGDQRVHFQDDEADVDEELDEESD